MKHKYMTFKKRRPDGVRVADVRSIIAMLVEVQDSVSMYSKVLEKYVDYLKILKMKSKKIPKSTTQEENYRSGIIMKKWLEKLLDEEIQLERTETDSDGNKRRIPEIIAWPNLDKRLKEIIEELNRMKIIWKNEESN